MNMAVKTACGYNMPFAGYGLCSWTDYYIHSFLSVWITSLADRINRTILEADISFINSRYIND